MTLVTDFAAVNVAAAARDALMLIEEELRNEQYKTDMIAYGQLDGGKLTSDNALGLWHKKNALYTLHRRLMQKARQGVSAMERIGDVNG